VKPKRHRPAQPPGKATAQGEPLRLRPKPRPKKRPSLWRIARGAREPGEWSDRFLKLLGWAILLALVGYMAWVLFNYFSGHLHQIKKAYKFPPEVQLFQPGSEKVA
jgi:hypothetical protein